MSISMETTPDSEPGLFPSYFLSPGTVHLPSVPTAITTILGSCIAVCLYDRRKSCGGMNHYILPRLSAAGLAQPDPEAALRYGNSAIEHLMRGMLRQGSMLADLEAKIFGGAAVLPIGQTGQTVGDLNTAIAVTTLASHGIPVVARRTGGISGLWVRYFTGTGTVLVRAVDQQSRLESTS